MKRPDHKVHPEFMLTTPMKENLRFDVMAAIRGAAYHLSLVSAAMSNELMRSSLDLEKQANDEAKAKVQEITNMMHWHIRAFFWELAAAFDTLLQWVNVRYELRIPENQVRPLDIGTRKARKDKEVWKQKLLVIEQAWLSEWCFEVLEYRNSAHRSFNWFTFEHQVFNYKTPEELSRLRRAWLRPAREGQAPSATDLLPTFERYLKEMTKLVTGVIEEFN